ncbi:cobaltochelatase subunit CobN [Engelhardtia mirabilis]|uniref:cobaltochelatase subunit CobN n=1 Tax=Engelhardtia mirabilis TaxID=2528011 RepID=UPI003AF339DD
MGLLVALLVLAGAPLTTRAQQEGPSSAAAPIGDLPRLGLLGLHGGAIEPIVAGARGLGAEAVGLDEDFHSSEAPDWSDLDAVLIQHLRAEDAVQCAGAIRRARAANPDLVVLAISGGLDNVLPELTADGTVVTDPRVTALYRASGPENLRRLILYVLVAHLGQAGEVLPPRTESGATLFHPEVDEGFAGVAAYLDWASERTPGAADAPRAAIAVHHIHRLIQQPRVVAALVDALETRGMTALVIEDGQPAYREQMLEFAPDVVLHICHSLAEPSLRSELGVPHLHSIFFRLQSIEEWKSSDEGLDASTVAFQMTSQEVLGAIEPQVGAGTLRGRNSPEDLTPIPDRIDHLADRAVAWAHLGRSPNADKHVAIVYYNRELGKADLMRGSATGMFLNAPRSLMAVLRRMQAEGYATGPLPTDEDDLLERMVDHGQQIGAWAPDELDRLARSGQAVLIPAETYRAWFEERVPLHRRRELIEKWGAPPGRIQVWKNDEGAEFMVLPRVELGPGVTLLPQPLRGEAHDPSLAHDRLVPPSHNYLATYFWLQQEYGADALVHFGTHGTEFLLPGKSNGPAEDDWTDLILGRVPNINLWVVNNLGESTPARRRAYAVLVDHMVPPSVSAGIADELLSLHDDIEKWMALEPGALREEFRATITERALAERLDRDLELAQDDAGLLTVDAIAAVSDYLHEVQNETTPISLHTLGEPPAQEVLVPYLVTCLGSRFLDDLAQAIGVPARGGATAGDWDQLQRGRAERLLELHLMRGLDGESALHAIGGEAAAVRLTEGVRKGLELAVRLAAGLAGAGSEIDGLMTALSGGFVEPGPGNSPDRNPGVLPTGRNMYLLNPEEIPSRPSWELACALIDQFLVAQLEDQGHYPAKVGFTLNSFASFQDYGVMEAQILYLLGVRPVWDSRNLVNSLELIPSEELGRPRIDVFISALSYYRDFLPSRMHLLDEAVRLVAALDEPQNRVFENTARTRDELRGLGMAPERADVLSRARLFGYPPGQMGSAGYYYLVERSGEWDSEQELMETYLSHVRHVYTEGAWGEHAPEAFERQIQGTEAILRSWSDRTRSPLSNKYDWYQGGSLSRAVKYLTGREPLFLLTDVRDPDRAQIVDAQEALRRDYRVRLFNRKWIEGMMAEGHAGGDQIAVHVSNTLGWAIMRESAVDAATWEQIVETYVDDRLDLGLGEWFEEESPYAYQELLEVTLEAIRKGYWDASPALRAKLAGEYVDSLARHGEGGGLRGGGNVALAEFRASVLGQVPGAVDAGVLVQIAGTADAVANAAQALQAASAQLVPARVAASSETRPSEGASAPPDDSPRSPSASGSTEVRGRVLEPIASGEAPPADRTVWILAGAVALLLCGGWVAGRGAARV